MSHEDVLFMTHAIQTVAESCDRIALTLAICTLARITFSIVLAKRPCSS